MDRKLGASEKGGENMSKKPPTMYSNNDSDLVTVVSYLIKEMKVEINHVKGHQYSQGKQLSVEEKFNAIADQLATKELQEGSAEESKSHARNGPQLKIDGRIITSNYATELRRAAESEECKNG